MCLVLELYALSQTNVFCLRLKCQNDFYIPIFLFSLGCCWSLQATNTLLSHCFCLINFFKKLSVSLQRWRILKISVFGFIQIMWQKEKVFHLLIKPNNIGYLTLVDNSPGTNHRVPRGHGQKGTNIFSFDIWTNDIVDHKTWSGNPL